MAWADLTDVRCYYEIRGEGDPLLLIAGLGGTCRTWDPVISTLSRTFTLILLDNRGMGQSRGLRPARNLSHLAADVVELLDYLQVDRTSVMGISLGGIVAQRLVTEHASRIDRLVLVSCTDRFSPYLRQIAMLLGHALRGFSGETFVRTVELLGTAPEFLDAHSDEIEQRIREKTREGISRRALGAQLRCLACSEPDPRYPTITVPTLVIAGEHDALIPNCYALQMAQRIRDSEFRIIKGAGHNPFCECPERVLPGITEFLTRGRAGGTRFAQPVSGSVDRLLQRTGGDGSF